MTRDEAIADLRSGARLASLGAVLPDVEGLVAASIAAALNLVADILASGGDPVAHIERIKASTSFTAPAEAGWREEEGQLTGKIGL